jgi:hypothetical protein
MDDDYNLDEEAIRDFTRYRSELLRVLKKNENLERYYLDDPGKHFSEDLLFLLGEFESQNPNCHEVLYDSLVKVAETLKPPGYDVITEYYRKTHLLELIEDLVRVAINRGVAYPVVKKMVAKEFKLLRKGDG